MTAATFTGTGRGKAGPEEQFRDALEEDTEEDLPLVLEDAEKQPKEGKQGASKSKGKKKVQATEGAEAPPEETPPAPKPTKPQTNPAPAEPQPGTSKAPTKDPTEDPTQAPMEETAQPATTNPDKDEPPAPTKYVRVYKAAGKDWLDSVVKDGKEAYTRLFDKLLVLGDPYIDNFNQADREQVFKCIRDKTGRFLDDDDFVTYVETEEEKQKPRYVLTDDTKVALTDYYDAVHTLCEAQQNFAKSTQVLENKIADKSVFLDIIKQVQLPSVKVEIRTVEEMERMEGKTYREFTLMCHLPNFKRINPNAKRTNQNDGCIHVLRPVRTDHRHKSITDRLHHGLQMPNDVIQKTDNREETARWTRQVERGKRRIQQKPGRSRQNGRCSTGQENKEDNQISNSSESDTQG